jgi:hypothetical protein
MMPLAPAAAPRARAAATAGGLRLSSVGKVLFQLICPAHAGSRQALLAAFMRARPPARTQVVHPWAGVPRELHAALRAQLRRAGVRAGGAAAAAAAATATTGTAAAATQPPWPPGELRAQVQAQLAKLEPPSHPAREG